MFVYIFISYLFTSDQLFVDIVFLDKKWSFVTACNKPLNFYGVFIEDLKS